MSRISESHKNYIRVSQAIAFLKQNFREQPTLADLAQEVGVSEYHLQRIFSEWAGVSPKQMLSYLTKEYAKRQLTLQPVFTTAIDSGLSSGGRLHDLFVSCEGVSPGEYRRRGEGVSIHYGIHSSPFGYCLIAITQRGICKLAFFDEPVSKTVYVDELFSEWPKAQIAENDLKTASVHEQIFVDDGSKSELKLVLRGSPFQLMVWEALLKIPTGNVCAYLTVANTIDRPKAVRAVASAIGRNPIAYLIPCHRVIRSSGVLSNYRWGVERKEMMLLGEKLRGKDK